MARKIDGNNKPKGRKTYRKIITSQYLIEQINPENAKLVDRFLKNMSTKRSPKTIINYQSNLNIFFCWNLTENRNKRFIEIKKMDLMDFFDYCITDLKWNSNRYAQMHSCLSSFSSWIENMYDDDYPDFRNIVKKIEKIPKSVVRKKSVFTKEELDNLMQYLEDEDKVREQCLLALMMSTGARISELCRFTTTMIDENNTAFEGLFLETVEEIQVKGRGVNGKHINRYIIKDLFLPYYKKWLPIREQILKENNVEHDYILVKDNGQPATVSTINSWLSKWDKVLSKHLYAHALRHWWTSYLLSIGVEKELVQELQSWSSDSLVDLYNDSTAKDRQWKGLSKLRQALNKEELEKMTDEMVEQNSNDEIKIRLY